ncbi:MAG: S41 family peptidase [Planctomycetia bacterium]|nr:S41 family peptidase [Planctomycetia bacterium]
MNKKMLPFLLYGIALVLACGANAAEKEDSAPKSDSFEQYRVLIDTIDQVSRNYVNQVSREELIEAAINGVIKKLDPYSNYIAPDKMESFRKNIDSKFGGIGVQVHSRDGKIIVVSPLMGTPAYEAGVFSGDQILKVGGESVEGLSLDDVIERMKGEIGTPITLQLRREGRPDPFDLEIVREIITLETVLGFDRNEDDSWNHWLDEKNGIAYICISSFAPETTRDMRRVLNALVNERDENDEPKMKGLILDLRFNPGGLFPAAVDICDMFLDDGRIVSTKGRNTEEQVWNASKEKTICASVPMVILINQYSASASEVVSACLQDNNRAIIVGERSWGKGSVQNVVELEDGASALKLTTAGYFRPNGKNIHRVEGAAESDEWGVVPNEEHHVAMTPQQLASLMEDRMSRQDLRTHNVQKSEAKPFSDPQLRKALDVLFKELGVDTGEQGTKTSALTPRNGRQLSVNSTQNASSRRGWRR